MTDLYLQENSSVLKNLLGITDEKELDLAEAELSRANMMLLYENGFSDFSVGGISFIHKELFGDVYEWAGEFRKINRHQYFTLSFMFFRLFFFCRIKLYVFNDI